MRISALQPVESSSAAAVHTGSNWLSRPMRSSSCVCRKSDRTPAAVTPNPTPVRRSRCGSSVIVMRSAAPIPSRRLSARRMREGSWRSMRAPTYSASLSYTRYISVRSDASAPGVGRCCVKSSMRTARLHSASSRRPSTRGARSTRVAVAILGETCDETRAGTSTMAAEKAVINNVRMSVTVS